jgi:magnesium chelatase subunit I
MWFDEGAALQVDDDAKSEVVRRAFEVVPGLLRAVYDTGLSGADDAAQTVSACELALEALVARKKISRSESGSYGRATPERRRPNDLFGGGAGGGSPLG